jgi:hypothetical protein
MKMDFNATKIFKTYFFKKFNVCEPDKIIEILKED